LARSSAVVVRTGCLYAASDQRAPNLARRPVESGYSRYLFHDPRALGAFVFFVSRAVRATALARHPRPRGATPIRLPDLGRRRPSIRCDILSQLALEYCDFSHTHLGDLPLLARQRRAGGRRPGFQRPPLLMARLRLIAIANAPSYIYCSSSSASHPCEL
jgi:hypothetical protein